MTLSVSFDERKMEKIRAKLGPGLTLPPLKRLISDATKVAQEAAVDRAPTVLGSIIQRVITNPLVGKVAVSHPGGRAMEAGRKPLAAGGKFPPPSAFAYITSDAGQQFAIARAVARRGTKGRFFMKKAKAKAQRMLPQLAEKAAREIEGDWENV